MSRLVMANDFTHSANHRLTRMPDEVGCRVYIPEAPIDGAPGTYTAVRQDLLSSTNDGEGSPSALDGSLDISRLTQSAMVSQPDENYLYYGWWVIKDKDGMPTAASAFRGNVGEAPAANGTSIILSDGVALTGSATYSGHAAGKFSISNPLDSTGDGGHFTADAMLTAKFGANATPNNGGVSGMIDNFMANGESVPWSVMLHRAPWGTTGAFATPADDTGTADVDESMGTTWSIDGNSAGRSGTWSGQVYDEMPGDPPAGDGSTIPTTVTGTFYSEFSTIGRMVGGFGADKQ